MLGNIFNNINIINIPISIPIPIFSSILSFINSVLCVLFMYKYNETKDTKWFIYLSYIFLSFLVIDLSLNIYMCLNPLPKYDNINHYESIFHHIITFVLTTWSITFRFGIDLIPDIIYKIILFEINTIFLNIRFWIKEYLKSNNQSLENPFVTKIQLFNDIIFATFFIYNRCYIGLKDIMFNKDIYIKLLSIDNCYFLNRFIIVIIIIFLLLNLYWSGLIIKGLYKKFLQSNIDTQIDNELVLIENLSSRLLENRDDKFD